MKINQSLSCVLCGSYLRKKTVKTSKNTATTRRPINQNLSCVLCGSYKNKDAK